jgi:hypothetical protein
MLNPFLHLEIQFKQLKVVNSCGFMLSNFDKEGKNVE